MRLAPLSSKACSMLLLAIIALIRVIRKNRAAHPNHTAPGSTTQRLFSTRMKPWTALLIGTLVLFHSTGLHAQDRTWANRTDNSGQQFKSRSNDELLREGTVIPPTVGMIVRVGRRWGFSPANPDSLTPGYFASIAEPTSQLSSGMISERRAGNPERGAGNSARRPTRLGTASVAAVREPGISPLPDDPQLPSPQTSADPINPKGRVVILAENLMLQRIVEAVVANASDNRWTISGEITEFRNQNRLRINTAQRTNEK